MPILMVNHGNAQWPSGCLRVKNAERMDNRAICTLPMPAKPLSPGAPKPSMAFVRSVADIDRLVGNAVAGCAYNDAIPLIFDDADQ
jgi:hypothetical protein